MKSNIHFKSPPVIENVNSQFSQMLTPLSLSLGQKYSSLLLIKGLTRGLYTSILFYCIFESSIKSVAPLPRVFP